MPEQIDYDAAANEWLQILLMLCWIIVIPTLILGFRRLYEWLYPDQGPTYLERHTGLNLDRSDDAEPMILPLVNVNVAPSSDTARLKMGMLEAHLLPPPVYPPARAVQLMQLYKHRWAIAGGWAIDLFLGVQTREHEDIELAVFRSDQGDLRQHLVGWNPTYIIPGDKPRELPWPMQENLALPIHEIHTRPPQRDLADMEFLLNETDGADWIFRRDPRVRLPLGAAIMRGDGGVPYLAPEIVLLYKAKHPRAVDEQDFQAALPMLDDVRRQWLGAALNTVHPGHPWLAALNETNRQSP
ncbi:hypothetical protein JW859_03220 [bacterium]|nr:hypothetical protein [bacterium]